MRFLRRVKSNINLTVLATSLKKATYAATHSIFLLPVIVIFFPSSRISMTNRLKVEIPTPLRNLSSRKSISKTVARVPRCVAQRAQDLLVLLRGPEAGVSRRRLSGKNPESLELSSCVWVVQVHPTSCLFVGLASAPACPPAIARSQDRRDLGRAVRLVLRLHDPAPFVALAPTASDHAQATPHV